MTDDKTVLPRNAAGRSVVTQVPDATGKESGSVSSVSFRGGFRRFGVDFRCLFCWVVVQV